MSTLQTLTYRFTLDAFKNGVQRILQGWVTGENIARKLEISLRSGTDDYQLPFNGITASMYVLNPSSTTPSINACTIDAENNKIIYEVLPSDIQEAGIVNMQLKVFDSERILISPSFGLEVWESTIDDSEAPDSPTYTALTAALAEAETYAEKAIEQVYIDDDYTFVIEMADGTEYTSSALKDAVADATAEGLKAEGYAVGKQNGEDVASGSPYYQNNAKYYKGLAYGYSNAAENAKGYAYDYANAALGYKNDASGYATTAGNRATLATSYAVGGTGTRAGEDTDNAKYYKEVCEQIAGGGLPADNISYDNRVSGLESTNVQDVVDEVIGEMGTINDNPSVFTTTSEGIADDTNITLGFVQYGTGDPTPSNVRTIVGLDNINLIVAKTNIWTEANNVSGTKSSDRSFYLPPGTYTVSALVTSSDTDADTSKINFYDAVNTTAMASASFTRGSRTSDTVTLPYPCYNVRFLASDSASHSASDTFSFMNIQVEAGSEASPFESFDSSTNINIALDDTLYSGTYDVESGLLTVDKIGVDAADLTWTYSTSRWLAEPSYLPKYYANNATADVSAEKYKADSANNVYGNVSHNTIAIGTSQKLSVYNGSTDDTPTGLIVYPLANPITYHLPPHQVKLLKGKNTVVANGTTLNMVYHDGVAMKMENTVGLADSINNLSDMVSRIKYKDIAIASADGTKTNADLIAELKPSFESLNEFQKSYSKIVIKDDGDIVLSYVGADEYSQSFVNSSLGGMRSLSFSSDPSYGGYFSYLSGSVNDYTNSRAAYDIVLRVLTFE